MQFRIGDLSYFIGFVQTYEDTENGRNVTRYSYKIMNTAPCLILVRPRFRRNMLHI